MPRYFNDDGDLYRVSDTYTCDECGREIDESEVHQDKWTFCPDCWREAQGEEEEPTPDPAAGRLIYLDAHRCNHRVDALGISTLCGKVLNRLDYQIVDESDTRPLCLFCDIRQKSG